MKKLFIFAAAAMGLGLVSCDKVDMPNPPAQSNPQEALFDKNDVVVVADPAAAETVYDLTQYQNEGTLVPLAVIEKMENIPAMCDLKFSGHLSASNDFSGTEFPCEIVDNVVMAEADVLNGALRGITKSPEVATVNLQLNPYIQSTVNLGYVAQIDAAYGPFALKFMPFAPASVIEPAYYLMTSTDGVNWEAGIKSSHSDVNPYDDPNFTFLYDGPAVNDMEPLFWKVVPESQYLVDPNGATWFAPVFDDAFKASGAIELSTDYGMNISVSGSQVMMLNMENMSFSYFNGFPQLYTPGNSNGWDAPSSQILTAADYVHFSGYVFLNGEFKFNPDASWAGRDFGCNDAFVYEGSPIVGTGVADGSKNINVPADAAGDFYVTVDYSTRAVVLNQIATYGIIGDATADGWNASTPMTRVSPLVYTVETTLIGGKEFKFRANDDWGINLGGDLFNLTAGGVNIPVTDGDGTYEITLDLSQVPYSATVVKK